MTEIINEKTKHMAQADAVSASANVIFAGDVGNSMMFNKALNTSIIDK